MFSKQADPEGHTCSGRAQKKEMQTGSRQEPFQKTEDVEEKTKHGDVLLKGWKVSKYKEVKALYV